MVLDSERKVTILQLPARRLSHQFCCPSWGATPEGTLDFSGGKIVHLIMGSRRTCLGSGAFRPPRHVRNSPLPTTVDRIPQLR